MKTTGMFVLALVALFISASLFAGDKKNDPVKKDADVKKTAVVEKDNCKAVEDKNPNYKNGYYRHDNDDKDKDKGKKKDKEPVTPTDPPVVTPTVEPAPAVVTLVDKIVGTWDVVFTANTTAVYTINNDGTCVDTVDGQIVFNGIWTLVDNVLTIVWGTAGMGTTTGTIIVDETTLIGDGTQHDFMGSPCGTFTMTKQ